MVRPVEQIADAKSTQSARSEERYLPRRAVLAQGCSEGIDLMSAIRQVVMGDGEIGNFDTGVDHEQRLVLPVPELMWGVREALRDASRGEEKKQADDAEQSARVHYGHAMGHGHTEGSFLQCFREVTRFRSGTRTDSALP